MAISQLLVDGFCFNMGHFEADGPTVPPFSIEPHFRPSVPGKTGPRNFFGSPRTTWNRPILTSEYINLHTEEGGCQKIGWTSLMVTDTATGRSFKVS